MHYDKFNEHARNESKPILKDLKISQIHFIKQDKTFYTKQKIRSAEYDSCKLIYLEIIGFDGRSQCQETENPSNSSKQFSAVWQSRWQGVRTYAWGLCNKQIVSKTLPNTQPASPQMNCQSCHRWNCQCCWSRTYSN